MAKRALNAVESGAAVQGRRRASAVATRPKTNFEKLRYLERHHLPDYLDPEPAEGMLPDGRKVQVLPPRDRKAQRDEISRVYEALFKDPEGITRAKVLSSYTSNYPQLAFDPERWLWPLWQEWRARSDAEAKRLLNALASGIKAPGWGWMSQSRAKAYRRRMALKCLRELTYDRGLRRKYREYLEAIRYKDPDARTEGFARALKPLIEQIEKLTGYRTSAPELNRRKLSGVLLRAVHLRFDIRERDLH